jgi:hypothetical protein
MDGLNKEVEQQEAELAQGDAYLTEFRQDLQAAMKDADDQKALKNKVGRSEGRTGTRGGSRA